MGLLPQWLQAGARGLLDPTIERLTRSDVHPNTITTIGFVVTVSAGAAFLLGHIRIGGGLVLLGGVFDILDGQLARRSGLASVFGSFYDSTLDRISEIVVFLGIFSLYNAPHRGITTTWMVYVVALALAGSLMVSYTRARAEALGIDCKVGLMQRPERVVLIGFAALLFGTMWGGAVLTWVLILMAAATNFTAVQRIVWVYRHTRTHPAPKPPAPRPSLRTQNKS